MIKTYNDRRGLDMGEFNAVMVELLKAVKPGMGRLMPGNGNRIGLGYTHILVRKNRAGDIDTVFLGDKSLETPDRTLDLKPGSLLLEFDSQKRKLVGRVYQGNGTGMFSELASSDPHGLELVHSLNHALKNCHL